jgi:hypothetical protein
LVDPRIYTPGGLLGSRLLTLLDIQTKGKDGGGPPPEAFKCLFVFISQQARGEEKGKKIS